MRNATINTLVGSTLVAGLIGFSSAGLAQSKAVDAYRSQGSASTDATATATVAAHPLANAIAADLSAYEQRGDNTGIGAPQANVEADTAALPDRIAELRDDLDAYYSENSFDEAPASDIPVARHRTADRIAESLARFEENGGSLNATKF